MSFVGGGAFVRSGEGRMEGWSGLFAGPVLCGCNAGWRAGESRGNFTGNLSNLSLWLSARVLIIVGTWGESGSVFLHLRLP